MYHITEEAIRGEAAIAFVESAVFTRRIVDLGLEAGVRQLQAELSRNPLAGALDPGTGGLRKIRMADPARRVGKRGSARVHYLYLVRHAVIYLLFVYDKRESLTLTPGQKTILKAMARQIAREWDQHDV